MRRARNFISIVICLTSAASGCSKSTPPSPPEQASQADASTASAASSTAAVDGKTLVAGACLSCHTEDLLAQQRLPKEKWAATVKKMVGWGANLDPSDTEKLVAYLAATYGPDAGPWEPEVMSANDAKSALDPLDDGPYASGDIEKGKPLFTETCSGCHGPEARGAIGVNLVERPLLYRAPDLAATVRRGRGKMPPNRALTDRQIADILAYLRSLRIP